MTFISDPVADLVRLLETGQISLKYVLQAKIGIVSCKIAAKINPRAHNLNFSSACNYKFEQCKSSFREKLVIRIDYTVYHRSLVVENFDDFVNG